MKQPYDRLPLCGMRYTYKGQEHTCRRAQGHGGRHRVNREQWSDEPRIKARHEHP